jgi:hypothetical protein
MSGSSKTAMSAVPQRPELNGRRCHLCCIQSQHHGNERSNRPLK